MILKKMNISEDRIILDPGIGFAKTLDHNYDLLKNLSVFLRLRTSFNDWSFKKKSN